MYVVVEPPLVYPAPVGIYLRFDVRYGSTWFPIGFNPVQYGSGFITRGPWPNPIRGIRFRFGMPQWKNVFDLNLLPFTHDVPYTA